jgi:uncharacterized membrane protein
MPTIPETGAGRTSSPAPAAFDAAMVHLYRGEMHRMTVWRGRLDTTSHWAILLTTGMTTFTLGSVVVPHYVLLLGLALNTMCMLIEARRYQDLHASECRLRLLERGYFSAVLRAADAADAGWRERLAAALSQPCVTVSPLTAARVRLRRNYLMLLYFVTAVWLSKIFIHPTGARTLRDFYDRLAVGEFLPSWFVAASACVFVVAGTAVALVGGRSEPLDHPA